MGLEKPRVVMETRNPEHSAQPPASSAVWESLSTSELNWFGPLTGSLFESVPLQKLKEQGRSEFCQFRGLPEVIELFIS